MNDIALSTTTYFTHLCDRHQVSFTGWHQKRKNPQPIKPRLENDSQTPDLCRPRQGSWRWGWRQLPKQRAQPQARVCPTGAGEDLRSRLSAAGLAGSPVLKCRRGCWAQSFVYLPSPACELVLFSFKLRPDNTALRADTVKEVGEKNPDEKAKQILKERV